MNRILYEGKHITIKVREVLMFFLVLVLLFFVWKPLQNNVIEKKKKEKIENICEFTCENINEFHKLMHRADLCSSRWFDDMEDYVTRLEEQNTYLKIKNKNEYKAILKFQVKLINSLKFFENNQNDEIVNEIEETFKSYKKFYDEKCESYEGE